MLFARICYSFLIVRHQHQLKNRKNRKKWAIVSVKINFMNPFTHYLKYIICITVCPIWLFEFHISSRLFSVMCLHSILNCNFIIVKLQYDCVQQFFIIFIPKSKCNTVQAFIYDLFEQTLTLTCEWKNKIKEYHIVSLSRPTIMHMVSECSSEAFFQLKKYKRDEGKNGESSGRIATFERHTVSAEVIFRHIHEVRRTCMNQFWKL